MTDLTQAARQALEALAAMLDDDDHDAAKIEARAASAALRAALEAQQEPAQPQGWVLVPEEPTPEMAGAMQDAALANYDATINHELADGPEPEGWCRAVYRAMLAARPKETT